MNGTIRISKLSTTEEAQILNAAFAERYPWYTEGEYYFNCLEENREGQRITLIAYYNEYLAGCCHLLVITSYSIHYTKLYDKLKGKAAGDLMLDGN